MSASRSLSFADAWRQGNADDVTRDAFRRLSRQALVAVAVASAIAAVWCAMAPLSGAVIAPAQLKVELNRKTIQHQEGGIVREILVRDGQRVHAGDPLVVVGDVRNDATLKLMQDQLHSERIRKARAMAEAAFAPAVPDVAEIPVTPETAEYWIRERALFAARRRVLDELAVSLKNQINDAQSQVAALKVQIDATETSVRLSAEELAINEKLVRQGFVSRARIIALQRAEADYRAHVGEYRGDLAAARQRISDLQARISQARAQYQSQAADELKDASAKVREIEERLRPFRDQVERQVVRSPVDGEVMSLRVSAPGAVVGPRDAILDVVPGREKLVVDARIRPQDIDHVEVDGIAEVRLGAFDARDTPLLPGHVVFVSPDRVTGSTGGESWFVATIEIDAAALERHPELKLHAGMPAEVYVKTPERTVLAYVARSLHVFSHRAMREP